MELGRAGSRFSCKAWSWVLEQLGIGGDGEGGILAWLKEKASSIWSTIKETIDFIKDGPIASMPNEGKFQKLLFDCEDGVVVVDTSGVRLR
ncbi:MAG: hypothetical protein F6K24_51330 [Okeania sp. SIO2D1]|nr:hypothetical protein [Okeania sp. SIO2D1]